MIRRSLAAALVAVASACFAAPATATASGTSLVVAPGTSAASGPGKPVRYTVEVERGLGAEPADVARQVEERIADHRGWGANFRRSFQRVDRRGGRDLRIVLVSPATTNRMCAPLAVGGYWNCYQRGVVVLNRARWLRPTPTYGRRVRDYRTLMVMHELGHALGLGHSGCPRAGALASPMMQQGKGLSGCRRNPWPFPTARRLPSRCAIEAARVRDTRVLRVSARAEHVGTSVMLRLLERVDGRWRDLRTERTDSSARTTQLVRSDARFLRVVMPGTSARLACSAVARVR